jgi:hypothetical protein
MSLTLWADKDLNVDVLEKYCRSARSAAQITLELWNTNSAALKDLAETIEAETTDKGNHVDLIEEQLSDKLHRALYQYGQSGSETSPVHVQDLSTAISDYDKHFQSSISDLRTASSKISVISSELTKVRHSKSEADQALLAAIMSKSELEKRFTPSAVSAGSSLPTSAMSIIKKCEDRVQSAQAKQLWCGERITELREQLDDASRGVSDVRRSSLEAIESSQRKLLRAIAVTSNEILSAQLVLGRELGDIVDSTPGSVEESINMSLNSSMAFSIEESLQGLGWLETIQRMDPFSRQLFELQNIAEGLSIVHADDGDAKIKSLESKIKSLQSGIDDLIEGRVPDQSRVTPTVTPLSFSLRLPLDRVWTDFETAEQHTELRKSIYINPTSLDWPMIAYEQVLLGYFEISTRFPHFLSMHHWNKLKAVVHMCRLRLRVPTNVHESLAELMLPDSVEIQGEIGPLDLRFRLCRILGVDKGNFSGNEKKHKLYSEWRQRQIDVIRFCVECWKIEDREKFEKKSKDFDNTLDEIQNTESNEPIFTLLELLTEYFDSSDPSPALTGVPPSVPRVFVSELSHQLWKMCLNLDEDNGLNADTPALAGFLHNFMFYRTYPHHAAILGLTLWEAVVEKHPMSVPVGLAKQVSAILQPGEKFMDKIAGDVFWFPEGQSSSTTSDHRNVVSLDLAYLRIRTAGVRNSITSALGDYRKHIDAESLEFVVGLFMNAAVSRMNTGISVYPPELELLAFSEIMCEYFIYQTAKNTGERLVDSSKYLDSVSVARAHASDDSRMVWIAEVTSVVWKVVLELVGELHTYSWDKFGVAKSHASIWSEELGKRIREIIDVIMRDDELWGTDRVPPGGVAFLQAVQVWERVSGTHAFSGILRAKISKSLAMYLEKIERDSLPACYHSTMGGWQATRPPQILHSTKCVDLWTTVFTAVQACIEAATAQLAIPSCSQLVVRCVEKYAENARDGFVHDTATSHPLAVKARRAVNRMIRSVDDDSEVPQEMLKKKKKNKLFRKSEGTNTSLLGGSGGEESDGGDKLGNPFNLIGDNHLFLSEYLMLTSNLSSHDATGLMVRLHDMAFALGELDKVRDSLKESLKKEDVRLARQYKANSKETFANLPDLPGETVRRLEVSIQEGVDASRKILISTGDLIVTYLGLNLVYIDCKTEIFEKLYMPTVKDNPLSKILKRFENDKLTAFCLMAPANWRTTLCRSVISHFIHAWVYVVADMAIRGRVYKESDSSVLNSDLTQLHSLADQLTLASDPDTQELLKMVGCLPVYISGSTASEFRTICEKAFAEPFEKTKGKSRLSSITSSYGRKPNK